MNTRTSLLFLCILVSSAQAMENPARYDQELTKKLRETRIGQEAAADNYVKYWPEIKELIELGADPNSKLDFGNVIYCSVFNYIIGHGSLSDGIFLLKHGISCDDGMSLYWTPLGYSIFFRRIDFVKLFLNQDVDTNKAADKYQQHSPLMLASHHAGAEIVQDLLAHGADQSVMDNNGKRAVDIAKDWNKNDIVALLQKQRIA